MPKDLSAEEGFELKLTFARELARGYESARVAHGLLRDRPTDLQAWHEIYSFFHRIAGSADSVDLSLLGRLAANCEIIADLVIANQLEPLEKVLATVSEGLAGAGQVLDSQGMLEMDSPPSPLGLPIEPESADARALAKILVVDDDPVSAQLIDGWLRSAGFKSSYSCDSRRALDVIFLELPDLIVLDVVMPGLDGFDLCRRVRSHPALAFTSVIFVTRQRAIEQLVKGFSLGGNDYLAKPVDPRELIARVASHVTRASTLRELAVRDSLTRCYNHRFFKQRLEQELARARRYKTSLSVGLLDIDHFKHINDAHGHAAGDAVLSHLSSIVLSSVRNTDVVARYGGEEFGLLLVEAGVAEAQIVTDRMRQRIQAYPFKEVGEDAATFEVTVSIGVAELETADSSQSLLLRTDRALYAAKSQGRNRVVFAS